MSLQMRSLVEDVRVESHELEFCLDSSVTLPARVIKPIVSDPTLNRISILVGHGLGERSHDSEEWTPVVGEGVLESEDPRFDRIVFYTARGHGASHGWQSTADTDPDQFQWPRLASDMIEVSKNLGQRGVIVAGESMGSATAFFAALQDPDRVRGVIMIRPPTAWDLRAYQRDRLERYATKLAESPAGDMPTLFHHVLRATARSDFPPLPTEANKNDDSNVYQQIRCPVLILAVRHDPVHPVETAQMLADVLPRATLSIVENHDEAMVQWPALIAEFIKQC